jgi:CheY-like chemotaxis protein
VTAACRPILVVEDDESVRKMICLVLESEGYAPVPTSDGLEALRVLDGSELPSVILLDIMMPRMDGEALVQALKASSRLSTIPVLIMSGDTHAREKSNALGVEGCLVKPVDVDVLLNAVQPFCSGHV